MGRVLRAALFLTVWCLATDVAAQQPAGLERIAEALQRVAGGTGSGRLLLSNAEALQQLRGESDVTALVTTFQQSAPEEQVALLHAWSREIGIGSEELRTLVGALGTESRVGEVLGTARVTCVSDALPLASFGGEMRAAVHWLPDSKLPATPTALLEALSGGDVDAISRQVALLNEQSDGAYQTIYFDGQPHLTFVQNGQPFHFVHEGDWEMRLGPDPVETLIAEKGLEPEVLARRFRPPAPDVHLIGLETSIHGQIVPLFSRETELRLYRDFTRYQHGGGFGRVGNGALLRHAKLVPLKTIRFERTLHDASGGPTAHLDWMPDELQSLFENGQTLATEASVRGLPAEAVVGDSPYQALMLADDGGEGRLGILVRDGVPLLVRRGGQEHFVELKGVGTSVPMEGEGVAGQWVKPVHDRLTHTVRYGRVAAEQAVQEFQGYEITRANMNESPEIAALRSVPTFGVLLPELGSKAGVLNLPEYGALPDEKLSGQVYRLSTTTRRVAFADNPVFGFRYPNSPRRLTATQYAMGRLVGDLAIREENQAYHSSLHAENFAWYPTRGVALHVDYSDIHPGTRLYEMFAGAEELGIFDPKRNPAAGAGVFYQGLRESLEPRGLWIAEVSDAVAAGATHSDLTRVLDRTLLTHFDLLHPDRWRWVRDTSSRMPVQDDRGMGWSVTDAPMSLHYRWGSKDSSPEEKRAMFQTGLKRAEYRIASLRAKASFSRNRSVFPEQVKALETDLIPRAEAIRDAWAEALASGDANGWDRSLWQTGKMEAPLARQQGDLNDAVGRLFGVELHNREMIEEWIAGWYLDEAQEPADLAERVRKK